MSVKARLITGDTPLKYAALAIDSVAFTASCSACIAFTSRLAITPASVLSGARCMETNTSNTSAPVANDILNTGMKDSSEKRRGVGVMVAIRLARERAKNAASGRTFLSDLRCSCKLFMGNL